MVYVYKACGCHNERLYDSIFIRIWEMIEREHILFNPTFLHFPRSTSTHFSLFLPSPPLSWSNWKSLPSLPTKNSPPPDPSGNSPSSPKYCQDIFQRNILLSKGILSQTLPSTFHTGWNYSWILWAVPKALKRNLMFVDWMRIKLCKSEI